MTGIYKNIHYVLMIKDMGQLNTYLLLIKNVFIPAPHVDSTILKLRVKKHRIWNYEVLNIYLMPAAKNDLII